MTIKKHYEVTCEWCGYVLEKSMAPLPRGWLGAKVHHANGSGYTSAQVCSFRCAVEWLTSQKCNMEESRK